MARRIVYLHGFASSPRSRKATYFRDRLTALGFEVEVPELAADGFENLTSTGQLAVIERVCGSGPVSLIGSSMGGYLAALFAARQTALDRVIVDCVILMAPAFDFPRLWAEMLGEEGMARWRRTGYLEVPHYGEGVLRRVSYKLYEDSLSYAPFPAIGQTGLIFHGIRDNVVPYANSVRYVAEHPNLRLQLFEAGHELTEVMDEMWTPAAALLMPPSEQNL